MLFRLASKDCEIFNLWSLSEELRWASGWSVYLRNASPKQSMILTKQYVCRCLFKLLTHNQALKRKWILGDQPDVEGKSPKAHAAANQELVNWKMLFSLLNTFFPLSSWQSLWHTLGPLVWKFTYCHSGDNRWTFSPHATSFKFPRGGTFFSWSGSHSGSLESDLLVYS